MSVVTLSVGVAMVASSAWLLARMIALPTRMGTLLAAYVVGFGEIVVIILALSTADALAVETVLAAEALVLGCVLMAWFRTSARGAPMQIPRAALRSTFSDPVLVLIGSAVAVGFAYSAILLIATPPNDWDAMTYHLARAAFWIQQGGVGYVPDSDVIRINANPPNGEIGSTLTMLLSGDDRFVGLPQFVGALALGVGSAGIARRLGLTVREALFGALALLALPTVMLQSSTALNDLIVASFLIAAVYLLLGDARWELALGGAAVALAVGTKFTAYLALPLLAVAVIVGQPRKRWLPATGAWIVGAVAGSYWLVVNAINTGHLDGGAADALEQHPERSLEAILARASRMGLNFADDLNLGRDLWLYPMVAALLAFAVIGFANERRRRWITAVALVTLACGPLVLGHVREVLLRTHERLWLAFGREDLAFLDPEREAASPSTVLSYYGPAGFALLLSGIVLAVVVTCPGRMRRFATVLAASPFILCVLVALSLVYDPWRGRFLVFSVALAAATWGLVLRFRWLAWGIASIAAVTVLQTFVHSIEKPAGVSLLGEGTSRGVWGERRDVVQSWRLNGETSKLVAFFAREPESGRVALDIAEDDWIFPYFGRRLGREVHFARALGRAEGVDWVVTRDDPTPSVDWALALQTKNGWRVYRRGGNALDVMP